MSEWAAKRFWQNADIETCEGGYRVLLDSRKLRTPFKAELVVPSKPMAEAIAAEWQAQEEKVDPSTMPVTRAANSAIDKVIPQFDDVAAMLAEYGGTDLLCYRAPSPKELAQKQAEVWDPYLDWARQEFDAPLNTGAGVMHVAQSEKSTANLSRVVFEMSPFELVGFHDLVTISGSLVLGLAATQNLRPVSEIWAAARVDEDWQEAQWGVDDEAAANAAAKRESFEAAHRFFHWAHKIEPN
ncbi:ATPase [Halocynthiibacter sp. C4]|uniref:ATP12 family chaperone protein n=1 Tax=Halocynthiibacter sp. C4 TaxID=2992758 RepID=UPI00237AB187|nr:ATP12 family protein [Halocynthiibacter sp. C4]MDE0588481.1 ATPase [Halocynthiibacter sp. C4]